MRISYWQKLEEAKKKGLTREQFEKIEDLEAAIAHHQNKIEEYEKEIKAIEGQGVYKKQRRVPSQSPLCNFSRRQLRSQARFVAASFSFEGVK